MPCRMGLLVLYQQQEGHTGLVCCTKGCEEGKPRTEPKVCQTAYQNVQGDVSGRSDSLWITTVHLFILPTA